MDHIAGIRHCWEIAPWRILFERFSCIETAIQIWLWGWDRVCRVVFGKERHLLLFTQDKIYTTEQTSRYEQVSSNRKTQTHVYLLFKQMPYQSDINMKSPEIMSIIEEIRTAPGTETNKRTLFKKRYGDFAESFPKLFEAALNKEFPLTYLKFMLEEKDKLESKHMTVDEADKVVYDRLREHYIDPVVGKTPAPTAATIVEESG